MKKYISLLSVAALALVSCQTKQYEDCESDRMFQCWAVTDNTHSFGEFDSLFYLINPIRNVSDSIYYNGNYTDSYYHSDSTRVTLRYTTSDSIIFRMQRLYAVETNPRHLILTVRADADSTHLTDTLRLLRDDNNEQIYRCGPDSLFTSLLKSGKVLKFKVTNGPSSSEPEGSQNYTFTIYTAGFQQALNMADSLNYLRTGKKLVKPDSINPHPIRSVKPEKAEVKKAQRHLRIDNFERR